MRASRGHSRPGQSGNRDRSGHGRNDGQRGSPTNWRAQIQRQVRTPKECEPRGTYVLESPDTKTSQDTERMGASEGHSLSGGPRPCRQVRTPNASKKSIRVQREKSVRINIFQQQQCRTVDYNSPRATERPLYISLLLLLCSQCLVRI